jgi:hypothetical protein
MHTYRLGCKYTVYAVEARTLHEAGVNSCKLHPHVRTLLWAAPVQLWLAAAAVVGTCAAAESHPGL